MALSALAQHCRAVGRLHETLGERIREEGMEKLLCEVELPLVPVLCQMEREGFLLDTGRLLDFGASLSSQIEELTQEIYRLAGEQFNIKMCIRDRYGCSVTLLAQRGSAVWVQRHAARKRR